MGKSENFRDAYYRSSSFGAAGAFERSASSGQIDMEITASANSSAPVRKFLNLNSSKRDTFGVPTQVLSPAQMSPLERRDIIRRLRSELELVRDVQKNIVVERGVGNVSSSNHVVNGTSRPNGAVAGNSKNSSIVSSGAGNKGSAMGKLKPQPVKAHATQNPGNLILIRQCVNLLQRLMSHQFAYVFNIPVDVVKLNIPDYFTIVKHPMDLGTIKSRLMSGLYSSPLEFAEDVRLTFSNAMLYNPKGNDVHLMAESLKKFFEVRWKAIERKLPKKVPKPQPENSAHRNDFDAAQMQSIKKRKLSPSKHEAIVEPVERLVSADEIAKLGSELESLLPEMPMHIIDFLREHSNGGQDAGLDEIEIDIDKLSDDTLLALRKLLDNHSKEKTEKQARVEPSEIELLNVSGPSNSSLQQQRGNDLADEDVDIGENEPPVSSYPPVEIASDIGRESNRVMSSGSSRDSGGSSEVESDHVKPSSRSPVSKVPDDMVLGGQADEKKIGDHPLDRNQTCLAESDSGLDQLEENSEEKPGSDYSDGHQDGKDEGESAPSGSQEFPHKDYRAAMIRNRFSDMILKAREEKTLLQVDKVDPDKLQKEREKLELQKKKGSCVRSLIFVSVVNKAIGYTLLVNNFLDDIWNVGVPEKARLQAEAKAAEDARKQAEAAAAAEARRLLEVEREAARQALLKVERTVEINENSKFLEDLEMLRSAPAEQVPSSVDEVSPDNSPDGLGGFKFGGDSNPLEQLGLFRKDDEEEEEGEPLSVPQESFKFGGDSNPLEQLGLFRKDDEVEEEGEPLSVPQEMNDVEPEEGEID
ncbi:unnamed protein product [Linum tenue]|uniref:Transcription factor GTE8 n=1 Tax=Linum tenue TaxID=586396 RepID=A0AAV0NEK0_9ROSI|nr:unnamed protein product [Linum tenue]